MRYNFKVGDEVMYVNNSKSFHHLTLGEVYKITSIITAGPQVMIVCDDKQVRRYCCYRFIPNTPEAIAKFMRKKFEEVK